MNQRTNANTLPSNLVFLPVSSTHQKNVPDDRIALFDDNQYSGGLTYGALRSAILALSEVFYAKNKELIVCCAPRTGAGVIAIYAATASGHAVCLLDPVMPDLEKTIRAYNPRWICIPENHSIIGYTLIHKQHGLAILARECKIPLMIHRDLYLLLLTSGSTGSSKAVRLSYNNLNSNVQSIIQSLALSSHEIAIAHMPLSYSFGLSILNMQMAVGGTVVLTEKGLMTSAFWQMMRSYSVTLFAGVPYHYEMLSKLGLERLNIPSLKMYLQAGGKMSDALCKSFYEQIVKRDGKLFVMYGQTEASPRIACFRVDQHPDKIGSTGVVLPQGTLEISDGEVCYKGPNVMMGYALSEKDLSRGDENQGILMTGDLGCLDAEGYLTITGRKKRFAKIFGQRVSLDDVEKIAKIIIHDQICGALEDNNQIVVFVEMNCRDQCEYIKSQMIERLKIHPSTLIIKLIEEIPHKENGKVDYEKLRSFLQ